jgi:hypothetical protein
MPLALKDNLGDKKHILVARVSKIVSGLMNGIYF